MPSEEDIKAVKKVLEHKEEINKRGAISIDGDMIDMAHLRWAKKIE